MNARLFITSVFQREWPWFVLGGMLGIAGFLVSWGIQVVSKERGIPRHRLEMEILARRSACFHIAECLAKRDQELALSRAVATGQLTFSPEKAISHETYAAGLNIHILLIGGELVVLSVAAPKDNDLVRRFPMHVSWMLSVEAIAAKRNGAWVIREGRTTPSIEMRVFREPHHPITVFESATTGTDCGA